MLYQELIKNFEQELKDFPHKMSQVVEMLAEDIDYSVATTPSDVVYTQDKMKLLHYRSAVDKQKIHSNEINNENSVRYPHIARFGVASRSRRGTC